MRERIGALMVSGLLIGGVGCAGRPAAKTAPIVQPAAEASPAVVPSDPGFSHSVTSAENAERLPEDVREINRRGYLKDNFFDYNAYEVRPDQREPLARDAAWLKKWPTVKVRIEGHCDERGTAQYNLALGERRAEADREYLTALGIDPSRIELISYGKERPFAAGHEASAWEQNRRDHLLVVSR